MNQITDKIWISSRIDAKNHGLVKANGITAVLIVANEVMFDGPDFCVVKKYGLEDSEHNTAKEAEDAIVALGQLIQQGHRVLVHCLAGVSRSVFVVSCYLHAVGFQPPFKAKANAVESFLLTQTAQKEITGPLLDVYLYVRKQRNRGEVVTGLWTILPSLDFDRIKKRMGF